MNIDPHSIPLPQIITAIGGLGTAAFGLLEAAKPVNPWINHIGFGRIRCTVTVLTPSETGAKPPVNALPQNKILRSLLANWVNGTDLASQKAIAKSLVKLHLSAGNAKALADATNVDGNLLASVATKTLAGDPLSEAESDVFSRFDLIVTAMLDESYQHADQVYRNWMRGLAAGIAVALSFAGGWTLAGGWEHFWWKPEMFLALLVGLLATPLAPIAKDLSTALATAVNTMQLLKK
ncbi:MAG: hypothetical protein ABSG60_15460 [Terracidiphilus sp.]|jgi:hypothetical protein